MSFTQTRKIYHFLIVGLALITQPFLSACALDRETYISGNRMEVVESFHQSEIPTAAVSQDAVIGMARDYRRYGGSPLEVTVSYNSKSQKNTARMASDNAARIVAAFKHEGVENVKANILPIKDSEVSMTYFSYVANHARTDENCRNIEGIDSEEFTESVKDYKLSCSMDSYIAAQVSRPEDLLGRDTDVATDGRKAATNVSAYRWGTSLTSEIEAEATQ